MFSSSNWMKKNYVILTLLHMLYLSTLSPLDLFFTSKLSKIFITLSLCSPLGNT
jgi:hypothetical protein